MCTVKPEYGNHDRRNGGIHRFAELSFPHEFGHWSGGLPSLIRNVQALHAFPAGGLHEDISNEARIWRGRIPPLYILV
jgi:hypothetical protein